MGTTLKLTTMKLMMENEASQPQAAGGQRMIFRCNALQNVI